MSTHNICFCGEIRKIFIRIILLSRPIGFVNILCSKVLEKRFIKINTVALLFFNECICCRYSLESSHCGSNENPQHLFLRRNKENSSTFWSEKKLHIESSAAGK